ncbi:MAG: hypothetical protein LBR05_10520 [Azoarcus sp.]|jgi:heme/copper-type cytochrome/quinol oxidase subunit 3|nr:hypothetical protein [Azoarcus sp.]
MASTALAPFAPRRGTVRRIPKANRAAKVAMLGSLAASLYFAATGNRRAHVWTGGVFVACLGVHLWNHRDRIAD